MRLEFAKGIPHACGTLVILLAYGIGEIAFELFATGEGPFAINFVEPMLETGDFGAVRGLVEPGAFLVKGADARDARLDFLGGHGVFVILEML